MAETVLTALAAKIAATDFSHFPEDLSLIHI